MFWKLVTLSLIIFPWITLFVYLGDQAPKKKRLEDLTDDELFVLQMSVFDEISRRGAEMMEPFEELKGGRNNG